MRIVLLFFTFLVCTTSFAQSNALAQNYYKQGEYEKAIALYKKLHKEYPTRNDYSLFLAKSYQQLEQYEEAEKVIRKKIQGKRIAPNFFVELGYNFALQNKDSLANVNYNNAIAYVEKTPLSAYVVGKTFSDYNLLDKAVTMYHRAMELNPERDYKHQLAVIYGEQGNLEKMFNTYIDIIRVKPSFRTIAQRNFNAYINDNPNSEGNVIFRKTLLKNIQQNPAIIYNELLSWLFIQQRDFKKAFTQEKAVYKRTEDQNLNRIVDILDITLEEKEYAIAKEVVEFIIEKALTPQDQLQGNQYLMRIEITLANKKQYPTIDAKFQELLNTYGKGPETYLLQLDYNNFLAFKHEKPQEAIANLKALIKQQLSIYQRANVKLKLADILVFNEKFNEALIYYSQVQRKVKNDILAQEARFKVARTSYFKGDFDWAQTQLEVLRKSASQLISNDAMHLSLMIHDNSLEDSTQTALRKFARADLLTLQHREDESINILNDILTNHKGESIEDETLLKIAKVYEKTNDIVKAENSYNKLIQLYKDDILADDAYFHLAKLYENKLNQPQKAKELYQAIIFNFADSIYFVEARNRFRMLRGDVIN